MRSLKGKVAAELRPGGGAKLRITTDTGEGFQMELSPAAAAALHEDLRPAVPAEESEAAPEGDPTDTDKAPARAPKRRR